MKGNNILLWNDKWNNEVREDKYPHLHSFTRYENISVARAMTIANNSIYGIFHLPLNSFAHEELHILEEKLANISINNDHDLCRMH